MSDKKLYAEKQEANEKKQFSESKNDFVAEVKAHKKQLIIVGISIPTLIAVIVGVKNNGELAKICNRLKEKMQASNLYSRKWFEKATDAVLASEREKVRVAYCASGDNFEKAVMLEKLLGLFDNELSRRAWGNEVSHAPSIHREHGWYLAN